jgi:hypothetical protein
MICVFLGPTMPVDVARRILDAQFLPPVERGDVLRALALRPSAIAIIDGYFDTVPSVWHKEILVALQRGVHVFGAASMGALRAAELDSFGMVGIGQVYEWYRDGTIDADDEVAVAHGPAEFGFARLSDAMVDIRDACGAAQSAGVISPETAAALVSLARADHYVERSLRRTLDSARLRGGDVVQLEAMEQFQRRAGPGLKERDARTLLETMATFAADETAPLLVDYEVERTVFLERLEHEVEQEGPSSMPGTGTDGIEVAGLVEPVAVLRKKVLLRLLARREADRIGLHASEAELRAAVDDFRRQFGLYRQSDTEAWAGANGVTNEIFERFMTDGVLITKLERFYGHQIDRELAGQMRMSTADLWMDQTTEPEL